MSYKYVITLIYISCLSVSYIYAIFRKYEETPEYIDGKWIIRYDITCSVSIRDRNVKQKDWMEYLMCRSDEISSSHPTFALVFYNHKVRNQLHKLGNVCLNTEYIDPNADI